MKKREITSKWFRELRDSICSRFEEIESEYAESKGLQAGKFVRTFWQRPEGGGGEMSIMKGCLFEKVGVNISTVYGEFTESFGKAIPGTENSRSFFATGISLVSHMCSPLVPAAHFNTRFIETEKNWFGGGGDLTPMYEDPSETASFHKGFKDACDKYGDHLYPEFKKNCDEYFFLPHRNEPRGVGGIFYDYYNTGNFEQDFAFTQDVGKALKEVYSEIVKNKMNLNWTPEQREHQLIKRGRYVEFNLLYDRGTMFGLKTNGNVDAILMSMPPEVKWP